MDLCFNQLSQSMKTQLYIDYLTTLFNPQAVFSDGTSFFRYPTEPDEGDKVRIRIRTGRENVDGVWLHYQDKKVQMYKVDNDRLFDFYETNIEIIEEIRYYFEIQSGKMHCYYDGVGITGDIRPEYQFKITPGYHTPDWAKGAVMYQIFVDRFYNGDRSNDVEDNEYFYIGDTTRKITDWSKYPAAMGVREFYGGDIAGVMQKLDYLQDLGVEVLYLNPIFVSPSNHKYDIQDYDYVDPHFGRIVKDTGELLTVPENGNWGNENEVNQRASRYICRVTDKENLEASNQLFAEFVEEVHKRGMKVILDGVFNHCGSFNKWLDRERIYEGAEGYEPGAFVSEDSPYRTFFRFRGGNWPYNTQYDGWWGHDTLPKLNYEESPELFDYIMRIAKKWVSPPYNVDGWRLDVAADLGQSAEYNHYFWKAFRKTVKEANPNAIVLAEHYGDPSEWLRGDEWDTVMNYDAFMEPLTWFLTGLEKHSDEYRQDMQSNAEAFWGAMRHYMSRFHTQSLQVAMNELSNHDHSRFMTRTNHQVGRTATRGAEAANQGINPAIMRLAVMIQMTWPGAPTIYYGDEAGVCGWTDPDNRRAFPWGKEDMEMIDFHKEMIRIHKDYQAFQTGSLLFMKGESGVIAYGRFDQNDKMVVIVNSCSEERTIEVPVWQIGIVQEERLARLIMTDGESFSTETCMMQAPNGILQVTCKPYQGIVLKNFKTI